MRGLHTRYRADKRNAKYTGTTKKESMGERRKKRIDETRLAHKWNKGQSKTRVVYQLE